MRIRPFRLLAAILLILIAAGIGAILSIDTHEDERRAAEARYYRALAIYEGGRP